MNKQKYPSPIFKKKSTKHYEFFFQLGYFERSSYSNNIINMQTEKNVNILDKFIIEYWMQYVAENPLVEPSLATIEYVKISIYIAIGGFLFTYIHIGFLLLLAVLGLCSFFMGSWFINRNKLVEMTMKTKILYEQVQNIKRQMSEENENETGEVDSEIVNGLFEEEDSKKEFNKKNIARQYNFIEDQIDDILSVLDL